MHTCCFNWTIVQDGSGATRIENDEGRIPAPANQKESTTTAEARADIGPDQGDETVLSFFLYFFIPSILPTLPVAITVIAICFIRHGRYCMYTPIVLPFRHLVEGEIDETNYNTSCGCLARLPIFLER